MSGVRASVITLLGVVLVASSCESPKIEDEARSENRSSIGSAENNSEAPSKPIGTQTLTEAVRFADVLTLWDSGKKDDAVKQLVLIHWDAPEVFANLPVLNISEDRFMSLPGDERTSLQGESLKLVPTLKAIARHALSVGDNMQASGDKETAKANYQAVCKFGEALSSSEHLKMIQMIGKGVAGSGQDKLSAVE